MKHISDGQLSEIFFCAALAATLIAMVFSPLELDAISVAAATVAIVAGLGGIYLAFCAWREPLDEDGSNSFLPEGTDTDSDNTQPPKPKA